MLLGLTTLLLPCGAAAAALAVSQAQGSLRALKDGPDDAPDGFVKALAFKHRLRVCNAYPSDAPLDLYRGNNDKISKDGPMPYKTCHDFLTPLKAGDKLEFKVGDTNAGTFAVSDLPNNDAVLLLVIHRHDTLSSAVSFESHVFANLLNAQVAVIDTFKGSAKAMPQIMDAEGQGKTPRSEELRYDSVVAVNPGVYDVVLAGKGGKEEAKKPLVALNRESYVVLRTGVEAEKGKSFPQELVVYPAYDPSRLQRSGAGRGAGRPAAAAAAALALAMVAAAAPQW